MQFFSQLFGDYMHRQYLSRVLFFIFVLQRSVHQNHHWKNEQNPQKVPVLSNVLRILVYSCTEQPSQSLYQIKFRIPIPTVPSIISHSYEILRLQKRTKNTCAFTSKQNCRTSLSDHGAGQEASFICSIYIWLISQKQVLLVFEHQQICLKILLRCCQHSSLVYRIV